MFFVFVFRIEHLKLELSSSALYALSLYALIKDILALMLSAISVLSCSLMLSEVVHSQFAMEIARSSTI